MNQRDAKELLTEWGKWVWQKTGVPRYVSPMLAVMRDNVPSTHAPDARITDEDAETISAIIARLQRGHPTVSACLHLYYCNSLTMHQVGERMRASRLKVRELLIMGEWYVQAELDRRIAA